MEAAGVELETLGTGRVRGLGLGLGFVQVSPESVLAPVESDQAPLVSAPGPQADPGTAEDRSRDSLGLLALDLVGPHHRGAAGTVSDTHLIL